MHTECQHFLEFRVFTPPLMAGQSRPLTSIMMIYRGYVAGAISGVQFERFVCEDVVYRHPRRARIRKRRKVQAKPVHRAAENLQVN